MPEPTDAQRREFSRVPVHLRADLEAEGNRHAVGMVESLSLKGAFFRTPAPPAEGAECEVRLELDGTRIEVHARGRVVRRDADGCAVQFSEIVGLDSLEHLRNLVLFNSQDPTRVEHEFHEHLGLKRFD